MGETKKNNTNNANDAGNDTNANDIDSAATTNSNINRNTRKHDTWDKAMKIGQGMAVLVQMTITFMFVQPILFLLKSFGKIVEQINCMMGVEVEGEDKKKCSGSKSNMLIFFGIIIVVVMMLKR